jgi:hypothetical protein
MAGSSVFPQDSLGRIGSLDDSAEDHDSPAFRFAFSHESNAVKDPMFRANADLPRRIGKFRDRTTEWLAIARLRFGLVCELVDGAHDRPSFEYSEQSNFGPCFGRPFDLVSRHTLCHEHHLERAR